jgi:hypothetical protein
VNCGTGIEFPIQWVGEGEGRNLSLLCMARRNTLRK